MLIDEIKNGESSVLEFKRELPTDGKKYLKTIVAFANSKGGRIVIGVDDKTHEAVGVDNDKVFQIMDAIANAVSDSCEPMIVPDIKFQTIEDKLIIVVEVHQGQNKPYYLKTEGMGNGTYVRVGATSRPATIEKVKELMLYGSNRYFDEQPYSQQPVSEERIGQLCKVISEYSHKEATVNQLLSWGLLLNDEKGNKIPSNAFELMTNNHVPFAEIQCGRFKGNDKLVFIDKREITGPVYQQIEKSCAFVLEHINLGAEIKGLHRVETYEIPEEAIREICTNAVVHRNYLQRSYIQIAVFDDRVEIKSPGGLYGGLTIEDVKSGGSSIRNKVLADVLSKMGFVEHWGTGVMRVFAICKEVGLREPSIVEEGEYVVFTFYRSILTNSANGVDKSEESLKKQKDVPNDFAISYDKLQSVCDKFAINCDNTTKVIFEYLLRNKSITNVQARELTGLSTESVRKILTHLRDRGCVSSSGGNKNRTYHFNRQLLEDFLTNE